MTNVASGVLTDSQPFCFFLRQDLTHIRMLGSWPQTQKAACLDLQRIFNLINQSKTLENYLGNLER